MELVVSTEMLNQIRVFWLAQKRVYRQKCGIKMVSSLIVQSGVEPT